MGKSLDRRARIITNKMNLQRNGLLYLCLLLTCRVSWTMSASFARCLSPANHAFVHCGNPLHRYLRLRLGGGRGRKGGGSGELERMNENVILNR